MKRAGRRTAQVKACTFFGHSDTGNTGFAALIYIPFLLVLLLSCVSTDLAIGRFLIQRIFQTSKLSIVSATISELAQARETKQ
jgi:hypothetical protein